MKYKRLLSGILAGVMLFNPAMETVTAYATPVDPINLESQETVNNEETDKLINNEEEMPSDEKTALNDVVSEEDLEKEEVLEKEKKLSPEERVERAENIADEVSLRLNEKKYDSASYTLLTRETPLLVLKVLGKEKRAEINEKVSNESKYLVKSRLIYDFLDELIELYSRDALDENDRLSLDEYINIYNEISCNCSKLKEDELNYLDEMVLEALKALHHSEDGKKFNSHKTYMDFIQETTPIDVAKVFKSLNDLWLTPDDQVVAKTKEVKSYLYSIYGFKEPEENLPETEIVPGEKPEEKPIEKPEEKPIEKPEISNKEETEKPIVDKNKYEPKDFDSLKEFVSDKDGNVTFKVKGRGRIAIAEVTDEPQSTTFSEPGKLLLSGKIYQKKIDKERYHLGARFDTKKKYVNIKRSMDDITLSITQYPVDKTFGGIALYNDETITYEFEFTDLKLTDEKKKELLSSTKNPMERSDTVPYVGEVFYGTLSAWYDYSIDHFPVSFSSGILTGVSGVRLGCATPGAAYPGQYGGSRTYNYSFTVKSVDTSTGNVTGSIWATDANYPANGSVYGYQELSGSATIYREGVRGSKLTYHGNGGVFKGSTSWTDPKNITIGSSYITYSNAKFYVHPGGFQFVGWNESPDGKKANWTPCIGKPFTWNYSQNMNIYALWKGNLNFDTHGGSAPQISSQYYLPKDGYYRIVSKSTSSSSKYYGVTSGNANTFVSGGLRSLQTGTEDVSEWYIERYKDTPYYTLQNRMGHKVVSGDTAGVISSGKQTLMKEHKREGGDIINDNINTQGIAKDQLWAFSRNADGSVVIRNAKDLNQVFDVVNSSGRVEFQTYSASKMSQRFNLESLSYSSNGYPTKEVRSTSQQFVPSTTPIKPGYEFVGWSTNSSGGGKLFKPGQVVTLNDLSTYGSNGSLTLHAQWTPNKYNVTYVPNGGNGSNVEQSVTFDSAWTTKGAIFNRPGYTQTSWNTDPNGNGKTYPLNTNQGPWMSTSGLTLYAQYTPHVLTVRYHLNGAKDNPNDSTYGSGDPALTMTYNYKDGLPSYGLPDLNNDHITPPTGYHIQGTWNTKANRSGSAFNFTTLYKLEQLNPAILNGNASVDLYGQYDPNKYTIVFDGNGSTGGTTPSINTKYDQAVTIPQNGFVKGPFEFIEWNTKPDGSGQSFKPGDKVSNLTSKDGDTIIIYAIWEEQVKVIYEGNGSTSGTRKIEQVDRSLLDTEYNYTVHKNSGYTAYAKTKHQFDGWWWDADGKYAQNNASYFRDNKTNKVTWPELMKHAAPAVKMSFRSVGFAALNEMKAANEMKTVEMYAQWDKAPTIEIPNDTDSKNLRTFYEGQTITEKDLVKTLKLKDVEDDITHKPLSARVVKIEYATGRLDNGNKLPGYTESYKNGMTSSDRLDTWFLELEKNKTVTHKVTYEVTDSAGNITQAVGEVYVKYNQFPVIQAEDRYFTLEEANAGKITAEAILNQPLADGSLFVNDDEEGRFTTVGPNPKQVKLLDFNAEEFKNFKEGGYRKVTLHTQDTFGPNGKGKETVKQITIYVVEDGEIPDVNKAKQVRFIDKKNYDKNKDVVSKAPMTESQMEARNGNGGLNVNSVWYHDADYRNVIENTFNKKDGKCYNYTMEQVNQIKAYVDQHGIGNIKEENALANFANQFLK